MGISGKRGSMICRWASKILLLISKACTPFSGMTGSRPFPAAALDYSVVIQAAWVSFSTFKDFPFFSICYRS